MKKYFMLFNIFVLFLAGSWTAEATKKYRYIKREHGVRFHGNIPMSFISNPFSMNYNVSGAYTYNWKGMVEVGPFVSVAGSMTALESLDAGLLAEYNFMKNRGKRMLVPALGLNVGYTKEGLDNLLSAGVHGSLKVFVGKRTPFIVQVGYNLATPFQGMFQSFKHKVNVSMGFAYYFDFY